MTITAVVHVSGLPDMSLTCSHEGEALPRTGFNPSSDLHVVTIKALVALLATEIARVRDTVPGAGVVASEALSLLRTASMTAVYAATTPKE